MGEDEGDERSGRRDRHGPKPEPEPEPERGSGPESGSRSEPEPGPGVSAWFLPGVRLERYRHAPGPAAPVAAHAHAEYQFGLSLDVAGEYRYRGARHDVAPGALRVIQAGEVHASRDFGIERPAATLLLYAPPAALRAVAGQVAGRDRAMAEPFFPTPAVSDAELAGTFRALFAALTDGAASRLTRDALFLATLERFVVRHAAAPIAPLPAGREPQAVARVRAFLDEYATADVSLGELADLVGLNPHYLNRAFARAVGLPPHRYQVQRRVERAKELIAAGTGLGAVAREAGFADQSHLGRHFKRLSGVSPGRYAARAASRLQEDVGNGHG